MSQSQSQKEFKFRAVGYVRVSSLDQVNGLVTIKGSLQEQEEKARAYARSQGWEYVKTYIEPGLSGEKFEDRLALQMMLEDARTGQFEVVIVKAGDRLARDQEVFFRITKILNQFYNVQILNLANPAQIVTPGDFNGRRNPMLIVQQGFDAMMAAFDQARRTDMLMEGKRRQIRAGRFIFPYPPYGYRFDKQIVGERKVERTPVPDPAEYWVLELLPALVLEEHLSNYEIACRLEKLGAMPRRAAHWNKGVVNGLLAQPFYGGKLAYGTTMNRMDENGAVRKINNRDKDKIIWAKHHYQHPWDWETYQAIQAERAGRATLPPRTRVSKSPLSGLIKCGYCGNSLIFNSGGHKGKIISRTTLDDGTTVKTYTEDRIGRAYFFCGFNMFTSGTCQGAGNRTQARHILAAIKAHLDKILDEEKSDPDAFYQGMRVKETAGARQGLADRAVEMRNELKEGIPSQIERLNKAFLKGVISDEQYPELTRTISEEKARLGASLAVIEEELHRLEAANFQQKKLNRFLRDYELLYRDLFDKDVVEWTQTDVRTVRGWLGSHYERIIATVDRPGKYRQGKVTVTLEQKPLI